MTRRLLAAGLFSASLLAAAPSHAGLYALNQPGSTCHPSNELLADYYQYRNDSLVNTGTDGWDVFVAACPFSYFFPKARVQEFRVEVRGGEMLESTWCRLTRGEKELEQVWVRRLSGNRGIAGFSGSHFTTPELVTGTVYCLVHQGASIDSINFIIETP